MSARSETGRGEPFAVSADGKDDTAPRQSVGHRPNGSGVVVTSTLTLPFPDKLLWPNGRTRSYMAKHRLLKSHREWAKLSTRAAKAPKADPSGRVSLAVTVHPKTAHAIDRDNCVAALKSYIDGIADALGVDDQTFDTPSITFADPVKGGLFAVSLTYTPHSKVAQ